MQAGIRDHLLSHQLHLNCFTPHEILAWEEAQRRKALLRTQRAAKPRRFWVREDHATRSIFESLDSSVLHNPLGGPAGGNELNCEVDPLAADGACEMPVSGDEPEQEWSDAAVDLLHEAVLHYSLKALQAKGNAEEKREILEWIFAPQPMVATVRYAGDHLIEVSLPQSETPFSFERCCRVCGFSSERLMDGLMPVLSAMGLGNVFNEIANGINKYDPDRAAAAVLRPGLLQLARGASEHEAAGL